MADTIKMSVCLSCFACCGIEQATRRRTKLLLERTENDGGHGRWSVGLETWWKKVDF